MASSDKMEIDVTCQRCLRRFKVTVDCDGYNEWRAGGKIQHCLPENTADERELLLSSLCDSCFNAVANSIG